jgi:hypothetical protein
MSDTNPAQERARKRIDASTRRKRPRPEVPDVLTEVMDDPEEFGPEDLSPETAPAPRRVRGDRVEIGAESHASSSHRAETPAPASRAQSANLSARRAASSESSGPGSPTAGRSLAMATGLPDLSRQITSTDLIMPKVKISQGLSKTNMVFAQSRGKEGVGMGSWYHTTTNRNLGETLYFIPVDMRKSRSLFEQGKGLVCRSFDLVHGEGDPGILCEGTLEELNTVPSGERGCSYRLWTQGADGRRVPPPCQETYNFPGLIVIDPENPEETELLTAMLQLRSTGTGAAKAINTNVQSYGGGVWHSVVVEIAIESQHNTRGPFFVPVVEYYASTDDPGWEKVAARAARFGRQMGRSDLRASIETDPETDI